ncbi:response regulator transcription factor [Paenibacillus sp.]|uniref:response regulator transcription factor n=1 Tax=Paenibacillus sp. TaxID=58172 RepID=UPI002D6F01CF|nr:helix-turn-helix domain-containing protein [Paenibacillus sp.]HZG58858.1 helix-turn-helix domain-containing protein [Paenibacillus sp.]
MYKVMIVDDEEQIRKGLHFKVDWNAMNYEIVAEAANGEEAVFILADTKVDVIITDMKMPKMDGIQLINHCYQYYPTIKIIVLSGYDDFTFVKAALQCRTQDYLLKPLIRKELIELLSKIRSELDAEKLKILQEQDKNYRLSVLLQARKEQFLMQIIKEDWDPQMMMSRAVQLEIESDRWVAFVSLEVRVQPNRLGREEEGLHLFKEAFYMLSRELAQNFPHPVMPFLDTNYPMMMHFMVTADPSRLQDLCPELLDYMQYHIETLLKVESSVGIGEPVRGLHAWKQGYAYSLLSWSKRAYECKDLPPHAGPLKEVVSVSWDQEKNMIVSLETGNLDSFLGQLHALIPDEESYSKLAFPMLYLRLILMMDTIVAKYNIKLTTAQTKIRVSPELVWQYSTKRLLIDQVTAAANELIALLAAKDKSDHGNTIATIQQYIDNNFALPLNLTFLSERYQMNATYLSEKFKKETGHTFSDYLTRIRMEKAKTLLADPQLKIADIIDLVGFSDPSYFSKAFKKYTGVSPNQFRSRHIEEPK